MKIDTANIDMPTDKLPFARGFIKKRQPKANVRRFFVDCHNGIEYSNREFDFANLDGVCKTDGEIMDYIRCEVYKYQYSKVYSCIEIKGEYTNKEIRKMPPREAVKVMRAVFYDPKLEPLSAYPKMI